MVELGGYNVFHYRLFLDLIVSEGNISRKPVWMSVTLCLCTYLGKTVKVPRTKLPTWETMLLTCEHRHKNAPLLSLTHTVRSGNDWPLRLSVWDSPWRREECRGGWTRTAWPQRNVGWSSERDLPSSWWPHPSASPLLLLADSQHLGTIRRAIVVYLRCPKGFPTHHEPFWGLCWHPDTNDRSSLYINAMLQTWRKHKPNQENKHNLIFRKWPWCDWSHRVPIKWLFHFTSREFIKMF